MRVYQNRLRVGIANHSDTLMTSKRVELILELRTEIVALQIMNFSTKTLFLIICHQSGTLSTQMRIIIGAVE